MGLLTETVDRSVRLSPASKRVYRAAAASFEAFAGSRAWTTPLAAAWRDRMVADGMKAQSVNRMLVRLRYCTRRLAADDLGHDFAAKVENLRTTIYAHRQALSLREIGRLLACCDDAPRGVRDRLLLILGLRTGLRATAMCNLRWSDIRGTEASVTEKGNVIRVVDLDENVLLAMRHWASELTKLGAKVDGNVLRGFGRIDIRDDRPRLLERLTPRSAHRVIADLGHKAKIERPLHPHLLRHSFVTLLLEAGAPTQDVMLATGHRSLASLSRYISRTEGKHVPVSQRLPKLDGEGRR